MIILRHKETMDELVNEINAKNVQDLFDATDMKAILQCKTEVLHSQLPLHVAADCTHKKIINTKIIDLCVYFEEIRKSLPVIYNITLRENVESYIGVFGTFIEEITSRDKSPPLPMALRAFLLCMDLDIST
eukprot:421224_1